MEPNTNADGATATATKRPVPRGEVEETGETQGVRGGKETGVARETQGVRGAGEAQETQGVRGGEETREVRGRRSRRRRSC